MSNFKTGWARLIEVIDRPLGFFVLALLIAETFLATVLVGSNLNEGHKYIGMWIGASLFLLVTVKNEYIFCK